MTSSSQQSPLSSLRFDPDNNSDDDDDDDDDFVADASLDHDYLSSPKPMPGVLNIRVNGQRRSSVIEYVSREEEDEKINATITNADLSNEDSDDDEDEHQQLTDRGTLSFYEELEKEELQRQQQQPEEPTEEKQEEPPTDQQPPLPSPSTTSSFPPSPPAAQLPSTTSGGRNAVIIALATPERTTLLRGIATTTHGRNKTRPSSKQDRRHSYNSSIHQPIILRPLNCRKRLETQLEDIRQSVEQTQMKMAREGQRKRLITASINRRKSTIMASLQSMAALYKNRVTYQPVPPLADEDSEEEDADQQYPSDADPFASLLSTLSFSNSVLPLHSLNEDEEPADSRLTTPLPVSTISHRHHHQLLQLYHQEAVTVDDEELNPPAHPLYTSCYPSWLAARPDFSNFITQSQLLCLHIAEKDRDDRSVKDIMKLSAFLSTFSFFARFTAHTLHELASCCWLERRKKGDRIDSKTEEGSIMRMVYQGQVSYETSIARMFARKKKEQEAKRREELLAAQRREQERREKEIQKQEKERERLLLMKREEREKEKEKEKERPSEVRLKPEPLRTHLPSNSNGTRPRSQTILPQHPSGDPSAETASGLRYRAQSVVNSAKAELHKARASILADSQQDEEEEGSTTSTASSSSRSSPGSPPSASSESEPSTPNSGITPILQQAYHYHPGDTIPPPSVQIMASLGSLDSHFDDLLITHSLAPGDTFGQSLIFEHAFSSYTFAQIFQLKQAQRLHELLGFGIDRRGWGHVKLLIRSMMEQKNSLHIHSVECMSEDSIFLCWYHSDLELIATESKKFDTNEITNVLRSMSFFNSWPFTNVQDIAARAECCVYRRGDWLTREGEPNNSILCLVDGVVDVYKHVCVLKNQRWPTSHLKWEVTQIQTLRRLLIGRMHVGDIIGMEAIKHVPTRDFSTQVSSDTATVYIIKRVAFANWGTIKKVLRDVIEKVRYWREKSMVEIQRQSELMMMKGKEREDMKQRLKDLRLQEDIKETATINTNQSPETSPSSATLSSASPHSAEPSISPIDLLSPAIAHRKSVTVNPLATNFHLSPLQETGCSYVELRLSPSASNGSSAVLPSLLAASNVQSSGKARSPVKQFDAHKSVMLQNAEEMEKQKRKKRLKQEEDQRRKKGEQRNEEFWLDRVYTIERMQEEKNQRRLKRMAETGKGQAPSQQQPEQESFYVSTLSLTGRVQRVNGPTVLSSMNGTYKGTAAEDQLLLHDSLDEISQTVAASASSVLGVRVELLQEAIDLNQKKPVVIRTIEEHRNDTVMSSVVKVYFDSPAA